MKVTAKQLEQAKAAREARIRILAACTCAWPVVEFRNRSGHDPKCPGHAEWLKQFDDDDEEST